MLRELPLWEDYGIVRSADVVYIQIIVFNTRTREEERAVQEARGVLGESSGIRP